MSRKKGRKKNKPATPVQRREEYDLKKSLNRLNQKKEIGGSSTISDFESEKYLGKTINPTSILSNQGNTTGMFIQISDSINTRYDKLKDDISNVSEKIGISTENLRLEIDHKLEKKLNSNLFFWHCFS
jgi:hypothetical protein